MKPIEKLWEEYKEINDLLRLLKERREELRRMILAQVEKTYGKVPRIVITNKDGTPLFARVRCRRWTPTADAIDVLKEKGLVEECCEIYPDPHKIAEAYREGKLSEQEVAKILKVRYIEQTREVKEKDVGEEEEEALG